MAIKVSGTTVVDDSRNITNVIGVGDTATTLFYGDGSGLSNTGATLSASSGSQRLVVTSETTGIMTTSATNANLTWNSTTNTLSATNVSIAGTLTYEDVTNVDSIGIITARSGVVLTSGNVTLGTGVTISGETSNTFTVSTNGSERVRVDSSGQFGIGTTPSELFHIKGASPYMLFEGTEASAQTLYIREDAGDMYFGRYAVGARMVIDDSGSVGIATLSPSEKLHVIGNILASGNVTGYSDETLKDNIQTIPDALDKIIQLRGVEFDRNDIEGTPHQIGVIAQEVEKIIPEVVTTHEDGIKSVAYGNLVGLLIEAVKDLKEELNELKARLEEV